jgi:hypothetical protein
MIMLLSDGCVTEVVYLDDNATVRWVCYRIIIFHCVCVCVPFGLCNELLQTFRARKKQTTNTPFFYRFVAHFGSSGQYRCEAVNDAGSDRMEMSLQVFGKMCYLRHQGIESCCKTVCVCVCVLVTIGYYRNTGAKTAEGAREMLCSSMTVSV